MSESMFGKRRKSRAWIAVAFILLPVYLVFFPYPAGRETVLKPVWALDLRRAVHSAELSEAEETLFPFRAGTRFGYATLAGQLLFSGATRYQVALSQKGFINYSSRPDHLVFMDPAGRFQYSVQCFGYPLLDSSGELLYSINTDLGGVKRLNADGEILWQAEFSSPMTSIAVHGEKCLIGLSDGRAVLLGSGGELLFEMEPPGSRIPVILGTALSEGGDLALVAGIDPQNLILVQWRGQGYEAVRSLKLESDFRRELLLRFGPAGRFLYVEQENGLEVLQPARASSARLPLAGRLTSFATGEQFAVAASSADTSSTLVVFRPLAAVLFVASLTSAPVWSGISGARLFLGLQDELIGADLLEE